MNGSISTIKDEDTLFENKPKKIIAMMDYPEIVLAGQVVGPFEEGNEYEEKLWIALELEKVGIVRIKEETLTAARLYPILHRERIQPIGNLSSLPEDFYPRLRRVIKTLEGLSKSTPETMREYEYVQNLSNDILGCRLKKIISLASTPGTSNQMLRNLTHEELTLYNQMTIIISNWRKEII